jgi:asparagine synthase (glutamine-hydrolysing)
VSSSRHCIEIRHPFTYRPLVEFLFSSPTDQFIRPDENRSIQRRALVGLLPEEIRLRRDKRGPNTAFTLGVEKSWPLLDELVRTSRAVPLLGLDPVNLRDDIRRIRHGVSKHLVLIGRFISLEMWLRNLEASSLSGSDLHVGTTHRKEVSASHGAGH